ncbi:hypothetical protein PCANB_001081 [Pneumocystis canis]|nr:hypothetical protein PCANB_001081 [Pneumocystis canis]
MILEKRNLKERICMFLRPTEELSSFFEVTAFIRDKNCLIRQLYVAIVTHGDDCLEGYKESALFLFCVKNPMAFVILKVMKIMKSFNIKIVQQSEQKIGCLTEILLNDEISLFFSRLSVLHEFIKEIRQHQKMLDKKTLYITNQNYAWLSFYKTYLSYNDKILSMYSNDCSAPLLHLQKLDFMEVRDLRIKVCTWNVNGKEPVEDLSEWLLYKSDDKRIELYVIGLQEVDLSTEAYLRNDSTKEQVWNYAILSVLGDFYEKVVSKQLVGILLLIYAHKAIFPSLTSIETSFVGCGIMGVMGNKGAVAVRLMIWDTVFCFVNSHLAAMRSQVQRRNQDFHVICRRLHFYKDDSRKSKVLKSLFDCDHLIWCGDLNYRIDMSIFNAKEFSKKEEFNLLLEFDQLNVQRRLNHCFEDFIEGEINFPPTFKYKVGTSEFDSSEKMRVPSWTDRILWKSKGISVKNYRSYMNNVMSDHKPISTELDARIEVLFMNDYMKLRNSLIKEYQSSENKMVPMINISINHLDFENVVYLQSRTKVIRIDNIGQVTVEFEFVPKKNDIHICKPWIWPCPSSGSINDYQFVELTVYVDNTTVSKLNSGEDSLEDILVLHLKDGGDSFISIQGVFLPTRFGMTLEQLSRLDYTKPSDMNEPTSCFWGVPKEILRMTEYLIKWGKDVDNLFFLPGSTLIMTHIREALDTGNEFDMFILEKTESKDKMGVISMAETLTMFLDALPDSVIPSFFYDKCIKASYNKKESVDILDILPSLNVNLFIYMVNFMRELFSDLSMDICKKTVNLFSSILMRSSSTKTEYHLKRQTAFFQWFLDDS